MQITWLKSPTGIGYFIERGFYFEFNADEIWDSYLQAEIDHDLSNYDINEINFPLM